MYDIAFTTFPYRRENGVGNSFNVGICRYVILVAVSVYLFEIIHRLTGRLY